MDMARTAKRLLDEQLRAKIVYYEPEMQTNAELDAITARVVGELKALQEAGIEQQQVADVSTIEHELIENMQEQIEKMLSARREHFLRHKIQLIQRRITNLFFSSEIGMKSARAQGVRTYKHADEALHAVLRTHEKALADDLTALKYEDVRVLEEALERLHLFQRQLVGEFLARSRPELEALLAIFRDVLLVFLVKDFRSMARRFATEVIRESRVAHQGSLTYKIPERAFRNFRNTFEAKFIEHLLAAVQAPLARKMREHEHVFRDETASFASDPRIYAEIGGVVCSAIYDYLHGEGFLDLPVHWQRHVQSESA